MLHFIVYGLLGIVLLAYIIEFALSRFDDPREPPRVSSRIPLVGHLLGLVRHGLTYYSRKGKQTNAEIYTLAILNFKLYVVNAPRLFPLIQRSAKTLSFRPFIQEASKAFSDASETTYQLHGGDMVDEISVAMRDALSPGPGLDAQNLRTGEQLLVELSKLKSDNHIRLLEWSQNIVVQSTSCGVYGQQHPFRDPEVVAAFWEWEEYKTMHLIGIDITGKGYAARQKIFDAWIKYFKNMPADASDLVRTRQRVFQQYRVPYEDVCKQEAGMGTAVFPNTVPTLYWTLYELLSRPELVEEVRAEVKLQAVIGTCTLDVAALKTRCPLLLSVLQETQRMKHYGANIRKVLEDTVLDGTYLLKKGFYVQMPGHPIHANPGIWGSDADKFDPYRFHPKSRGGAKQKSMSNTFLAWGAAPHLCPARQFASTEIMIIVALLVIKADVTPLTGSWERTPKLKTSDPTVVLNPAKDVDLKVVLREEGKQEWKLKMGESTTRVSLASG